MGFLLVLKEQEDDSGAVPKAIRGKTLFVLLAEIGLFQCRVSSAKWP